MQVSRQRHKARIHLYAETGRCTYGGGIAMVHGPMHVRTHARYGWSPSFRSKLGARDGDGQSFRVLDEPIGFWKQDRQIFR